MGATSPSGGSGRRSGRGVSTIRRTLPASLPLYCSRSFSLSIFTSTSGPRTGPEVPGVHALGSAARGTSRGATMRRLARLYDQPRPKG